MKILLVEDNVSLAAIVRMMLEGEGASVDQATDGLTGFRLFEQNRNYDVVVTDIKLPTMSGFEVFEGVNRIDPSVPVIIMTAFGTVPDAVRAIKAGAFDYITKPFDNDEFLAVVKKAFELRVVREENKALRAYVRQTVRPEMVGNSTPMRALRELIESVAPTNAPVLITGESGTGKELVARELHALGSRAERPFVAINCAAIPEHLFESELFGHRKGAFTGADRDKRGRIQESEGGTLFLDEIGELPLPVQSKLLRFMQEGEIEPLGASRPVKVDARVVMATNRDLKAMVDAGTFREDLFYRIAVFPVNVPPLRDRRDDIPLLVRHFLVHYGYRHVVVQEQAMAKLCSADWPGNVRELANTVYRLCILAKDGAIADVESENAAGSGILETTGFRLPPDSLDFEEFEKKVITEALRKFGGNKSRAAEYLKIPRHILLYRLEKWGLRL